MHGTSDKIIAIGASTGGVEALKAVLMLLPEDVPPVLITQHMPERFTAAFARRLDSECRMRVHEAVHDQPVERGNVYIAPGAHHLELARRSSGLYCSLNDGPPVSGHRPSVDVLFESVARTVAPRAVGVILTGMGRDGAKGLLAMRKAGCATLGQDEGTALVYGMPRVAFEIGAVEFAARSIRYIRCDPRRMCDQEIFLPRDHRPVMTQNSTKTVFDLPATLDAEAAPALVAELKKMERSGEVRLNAAAVAALSPGYLQILISAFKTFPQMTVSDASAVFVEGFALCRLAYPIASSAPEAAAIESVAIPDESGKAGGHRARGRCAKRGQSGHACGRVLKMQFRSCRPPKHRLRLIRSRSPRSPRMRLRSCPPMYRRRLLPPCPRPRRRVKPSPPRLRWRRRPKPRHKRSLARLKPVLPPCRRQS